MNNQHTITKDDIGKIVEFVSEYFSHDSSNPDIEELIAMRLENTAADAILNHPLEALWRAKYEQRDIRLRRRLNCQNSLRHPGGRVPHQRFDCIAVDNKCFGGDRLGQPLGNHCESDGTGKEYDKSRCHTSC
ncbi:MAG: hypothetical protein ACI8PP_001996 [Candidatus Pseudothioglobus sp.]|jgi:hypothetical protein